MISSISLPQKFSRDLYVRLRARELYQLELTHLYSEVFATAACQPVSGSTEWRGSHDAATISMGWDWVLRSDGVPSYSRPQMLRSNIMLVSDKGYDLGPEMTAAVCEQVVLAMPWCSAVTTLLHGKLH